MTALATVHDVEAVVATSVPIEDQAFVARLIEMVSASVIRYTGQNFTVAASESVVIHPHDGVLRLPQHPVTAVTSVTVGTTLIDPTVYEVHTNGYLRRVMPLTLTPDSQFLIIGGFGSRGMQWPADGEFGWPPLPTTVVYTHGYATTPDDIAMVVAEKVAEKWLGGVEQASRTTLLQMGEYREQFMRNAETGAWSPEQKKILDYYRRSGFASVRLG